MTIIKAIFVTYYFIVNNISSMNLGTTLAIFIIVAVVLLLSFCLLLKYYSYKLKQQRRQSVNIDALDDIVYRSSEQIIEGAYQQFLQRRKLKKSNEMKQMTFQQDRLIQNSELRQVLDISNNIYGISKLRQSLNFQVPALSLQSSRSLATIKSFNITKLNIAQSDRQRAYYTYTYKIVSYTEKGLCVLEVDAQGIKKVGVSYQLVKEFDISLMQEPSQEDFLDQLQAYGFYPLNYGYHKYIRSVDVTELKEGQTSHLKTMKAHYKKQTISQNQFQKLKQEIKNRKK